MHATWTGMSPGHGYALKTLYVLVICKPGLKYSGLFFFFSKYKQVCHWYAHIRSFLDYWKKHGKINSEQKRLIFTKHFFFWTVLVYIGRPMIRVFFRHTFLTSIDWQQKHLIWPHLRCGICLMNPSATSSLLTTPDLNWERGGITWSPKCYTFKLGWRDLLSIICCSRLSCHIPLSELSTTSWKLSTRYMWGHDTSTLRMVSARNTSD